MKESICNVVTSIWMHLFDLIYQETLYFGTSHYIGLVFGNENETK
jgi:hypothetical protein